MNNPFVHPAPIDTLIEDELTHIINKIGSLLYIITNKKINHSKLLYEILKNKELKNATLKITTLDNIEQLVYEIVKRYPEIVRSKNILKIKKH